MKTELVLMSESDVVEFKKNIQFAFQKGFEEVFGKCEETILPEDFIGDGNEGMFAFRKVM